MFMTFAVRWSRIFNSRLLSWLATHGNYYFGIIVVALLILFAGKLHVQFVDVALAVRHCVELVRMFATDAVNQMKKYGQEVEPTDHATTMQTHTFNTMMKFRGQRNFYITGFALLLIVFVSFCLYIACLYYRVLSSFLVCCVG